MGTIPGRLIGATGSIAYRTAIASKLAADGGRRSTERCRNRPDRAPRHDGSRDLFPVSQRQCRLRTLSADRTYAAGLGQNAMYRRVKPIKQPGNLVNRVALSPAVPDDCALACRVVNPWPLLH